MVGFWLQLWVNRGHSTQLKMITSRAAFAVKRPYVAKHALPAATAPKATSLPPTFRSLYRTMLRAASTSVLHQPLSTRMLRALLRPSFSDAATVITSGRTQPAEAEQYLKTWNERSKPTLLTHQYLELTNPSPIVDNTLSMLYSSSVSSGTAHRVLSNLTSLFRAHILKTHPEISKQNLMRWDAQREAAKYEALSTKGKSPLDERRRRVSSQALNAWSEVHALAEGTAGISLGQFPLDKKSRTQQ